jgi:hypothetical protein
MVALYYGVVPTKVRKTPRDLAQTSIYATLHQHRTLRCGGERRRRRVSGAFRTNHRRAMGELYQVKGNGPNQPGGRPNSRVTRGHFDQNGLSRNMSRALGLSRQIFATRKTAESGWVRPYRVIPKIRDARSRRGCPTAALGGNRTDRLLGRFRPPIF